LKSNCFDIRSTATAKTTTTAKITTTTARTTMRRVASMGEINF
jgi:hypothetical protein